MQTLQGLENIDRRKLSKATRPKTKNIKVTPKIKVSTVEEPKISWVDSIKQWFGEKFKSRESKRIQGYRDTIRKQNVLLRERNHTNIDRSKLKKWSNRVREIGKCDICGSKEKLTAHHLWDKASHPTLMYQDENGVCLCDDHHKEFHKKHHAVTQVTPKMYERFKIKKQTENHLGWS